MKESVTVTKFMCDRCEKEVQSLTTIYKVDPSVERYDSYCGHRSVGDLCEVCFWEFQNFMDGMR